MITWNRREEALLAVKRLVAMPEQPTIVVVDNGSAAGTTDALRAEFPEVDVVRSEVNLGAVGRNVGVRRLTTPYVAFCDDDAWWEPGSLSAAADVLDRYDRLAAVNSTIVSEPSGREDPIVRELRESPVEGPAWLPGPAIGSFLGSATVLRREAFEQTGGFSERLWLGGEEELLAVDLATAGWELCFCEHLVVHHQASLIREHDKRRRDGLRNTLWFLWLRRPATSALRRTWHLARTVPRDRISLLAAIDAVRGAPWVIRERRVVPARVEARLRALDIPQTTSTARRYVDTSS